MDPAPRNTILRAILYVLYRPVGLFVLSAWFAGSLVLSVTNLAFPLDFLFSPFHLLFLLGIAIAHITSRVRIPAPNALIAAGFMVLAIAWVTDPGHRVDGLNSQLIGF